MPKSGLTPLTTDSRSLGRTRIFASEVSFSVLPPKVIWVAIGNCSTARIELLLRERKDEIARFLEDPEEALLVLA